MLRVVEHLLVKSLSLLKINNNIFKRIKRDIKQMFLY